MATHNSADVGNTGAATLGSGMAMNVKGWAAVIHIISADTTGIADSVDFHDPAHMALSGSIVGNTISTTNAVPSALSGTAGGAGPSAVNMASAIQASMVLTSNTGKTYSFSATLTQIQLGRNNIEGTVTYNFVSYGGIAIA